LIYENRDGMMLSIQIGCPGYPGSQYNELLALTIALVINQKSRDLPPFCGSLPVFAIT